MSVLDTQLSIVENRIVRGKIAILLMLLCATASADWQEQISQTLIADWAQMMGSQGQRVEISYTSVNGPRLPDCSHTPTRTSSMPLSPGRNQIELTCQSPRWTYNLPIQLHVWQPVAILTKTVSSDESLTPDNVVFSEQDIGELSQGFVSTQSELLGMTSKRPLRAGTILNPAMLEKAQVIDRGDLVLIRMQRSGIALETRGVALSDGRLDETIAVKNQRSGKKIRARVTGKGEVQVE